ncbi:MAG: NADH:flavin oxidoreductase/NADH oxidase [Candidatus Tectomicrobia bacterium]|uniref:NADH:flavin oxidoreductase/NADH oxidase n=1 Tax=Tectimicrobiota bacterium TaxID=2528274 RepID=A0A937W1U0_UNCTE|nr:NADH:flavin oxidoreductase/NADH oxidase [Candidatus Tectomicrobia bacterium]
MQSALFTPLTMRDLTLENRIVVSPMCQYSAQDGTAQDWHLMHLGQYAVSGVGLVIAEAAAVEPRGRITPQCLGLYSNANEAALKRILDFCRTHGAAKMGIQLAHAGRKASTHRPWEGRKPLAPSEGAWQTVSSSAVPHDAGWHQPVALDTSEMQRVKGAFVSAVERAVRAGFEVIELHSAHGYLLHQFLSPLANQRTDAYGGSLENRLRFPLEVFAAMRAAWPAQFPMGVRVSTTDWVEGGWSPEDAVVYARELKRLGCDYITASSGGISEQQHIQLGQGYQVAFAAKIRKEAGLPSMAVGMIFDPHHAEHLVADGAADMVALGRGLLFDTHWAWTAAAALGSTVTPPPQYERAFHFRFLQEMRGATSA